MPVRRAENACFFYFLENTGMFVVDLDFLFCQLG